MNEKTIWDFLYDKIKNPYGTAALMGNLYAESGLNPKNLQGSYERKLNMTDEEYTEAVDNWTYTNFVFDSAGYGLAQWTYSSRKENLLMYASQTNRSIGDLAMQLEFLWKELQTYKSCLRSVCEAKSIREASDIIVTQYEKPKNQSEESKQNRANYGRQFYNMFMDEKGESNMITLSSFLSAIQENVNRIKAYKLGNDGSNGTCDCIGLIIGAVRLAGGEWTGTHGSNWAARNAIDDLEYIPSVSKMFLGEIVFKARNPGEDKYDLPSSYKNSPDQKDYYHVGVVTSINPLCITHCTGVAGGIKRDTVQGNWKYGGKLKYVDYEKGESEMEEPLYRAIVTAPTGKTVNMRSNPSVTSKVLFEVPIGTNIEVMDVLDGWSAVQYFGRPGYMMTKFLKPEGSSNSEDDVITKEQLQQVKTNLLNALEIINKALA